MMMGRLCGVLTFFFLDVVLVWRCLIAITRRNIKPVRGSFPTSQKNAPSSSRHPPKPKHTWQLRIDRIFTPPSLKRLKLFYASKLSQLDFIIRRSTPSTQSPTSSYLRASTQHLHSIHNPLRTNVETVFRSKLNGCSSITNSTYSHKPTAWSNHIACA